MRRFEIHRERDVSGVSGTGVVAEGVEFATGVVAVAWVGARPSYVVWPGGIADAEFIHGHGGASRIVWIDDEFGQNYVQPKAVYREPRMAPTGAVVQVDGQQMLDDQIAHAAAMRKRHER